MQNFQKIAITVAFSFTCFSVPVLGAAAQEKEGSAAVVPGVKIAGVLPGSGTGEAPGASIGIGVDRGVELPTKPDWAGSLASQVKALREQYKKDKQVLLNALKEMQKQSKEVGKEERDKVRAQFQVRQEELAARQKELREEFKRRNEELRTGHLEHLEVIDAAKERAKEAVRERRGHSDR